MTDVSAGVSITAPNSAISSSANTNSLTEKETSNVAGGGTGKPIGGKAKSVTSYNSDTSLVSKLDNHVGVDISYSKSDLASSIPATSKAPSKAF